MPPKKKSKKAVAAEPSAAAPPPAAIPVDPRTLTPDGIEQLRKLSQYRPQRLQVGGVQLVGVGLLGNEATPPPPPPVTLQIVQINKCQCTQTDTHTYMMIPHMVSSTDITRFVCPPVLCVCVCRFHRSTFLVVGRCTISDPTNSNTNQRQHEWNTYITPDEQ